MTNKINEIPPWEPDAILDDLAKFSGRSRARLERELGEIAGEVSQAHLSFEQVQRDEFSSEQKRHLNECAFCQRLHATLHPSDEIIGSIGRRISLVLADNEPAQLKRLPGSPRATRKSVHWGPGFALAAGFAGVVGFGLVFVNQRYQAASLASLPADSQFLVAQSLANQGQYIQANRVLLVAFEKGGLTDETLFNVSEVLRTPQTPLSELRQRIAWRTARPASSQAGRLMHISASEIKSGDWQGGYVTLAAYLKTVEPHAPATDGFQEKFVAQLEGTEQKAFQAQDVASIEQSPAPDAPH